MPGHILFRDARDYARERLDPTLPLDARAAAEKAIDDALYGLMMVIDGVTGGLASAPGQPGPRQSVDLRVQVELREDDELVDAVDPSEGDGMCMGFHQWIDGDFGKDPITEP